ncbi:MAG: ABC transporter permease [Spirochaetales bacterium]|nr:ABC transporter permease [Spirochaetales bacterium]
MEKKSKIKKRRTQTGEILHRFRKNKGAMIGLAFILILTLLALLGNVIYDYDTDIIGQNYEQRFVRPCWEHPFGTDNLGRDLFARVIYGARASLPVGFLAVLVSLFFGLIFGAVAGFYGGVSDNIIMRIMDIFNTIPTILMAIVMVAVMGTSTMSLILAVGITSVPKFARITRAAVLTVRGQEFVESARAIGLTTPEIIFKHVVPNCLSPIIVQTTLQMGKAIITASSMSYLNLGVPAPMPEWGSLLSAGRNYIRDYGYLTIFPGLMIMVTVIAFNMVGDGLRDAMDPKLKK